MIVRLPNGLAVHALRRVNTLALYEELFERGVYRDCLQRLPGKPTIIDVGANIGLFAIWVRQHRPLALLHCIEPADEPFECLKRNADDYSPPRWITHRTAVGERNGQATLTYYPRLCEASTLSPNPCPGELDSIRSYIVGRIPQLTPGRKWVAEPIRRWLMKPATTMCPLTTLSSLIGGVCSPIDLLKIDAEKHEEQILAGIESSDWARIDQIMIETHLGREQDRRVERLLMSEAFAVSVTRNPMVHDTSMIHGWRNR
jgi:FkbM family methyltransferase